MLPGSDLGSREAVGASIHPLRAARHERLCTQVELAESSGVALRTIQNIESGKHRPRLQIRRRIMRALHLGPTSEHWDYFGELPVTGPRARWDKTP